MKILRILVLCGALGLTAMAANANTHGSNALGNNQIVAHNTVYYGYSPYYYRDHVRLQKRHNNRVFIYVKPAYHGTYGHHHRHHGYKHRHHRHHRHGR